MRNQKILWGYVVGLICLAYTEGFCSPKSNVIATRRLNKGQQTSFAMPKDDCSDYSTTSSIDKTRKAFLASTISTVAGVASFASSAYADEEGFASIAAKAASIAKTVEATETELEEARKRSSNDPRTAYEFSLPVAGLDVPFEQLIKQEYTISEIPGNEEGEVITKKEPKVKAILVVNIKQDDPIARKNIPELISLASK